MIEKTPEFPAPDNISLEDIQGLIEVNNLKHALTLVTMRLAYVRGAIHDIGDSPEHLGKEVSSEDWKILQEELIHEQELLETKHQEIIEKLSSAKGDD